LNGGHLLHVYTSGGQLRKLPSGLPHLRSSIRSSTTSQPVSPTRRFTTSLVSGRVDSISPTGTTAFSA
jgi:hypothetical protein